MGSDKSNRGTGPAGPGLGLRWGQGAPPGLPGATTSPGPGLARRPALAVLPDFWKTIDGAPFRARRRRTRVGFLSRPGHDKGLAAVTGCLIP